jgi:hypothetical protein
MSKKIAIYLSRPIEFIYRRGKTMTTRIRNALENCQRKESAIDSIARRLKHNEGAIKPIALTVVGAAISAAIPEISSSLSTLASHIAAFKSAEPGIFWGIAGGLVGVGALMTGVGYLEHRESNELGSSGAAMDFYEHVHASWDQIVRNSTTLSRQVAQSQNQVGQAMSGDNTSAQRILSSNGINPNNRHALLDLQRAYVHGLKTACVIAEDAGRRVELTGHTFDQFTNKNILKGMETYYQAHGSKTNLATNDKIQAADLARAGLSAIREINKQAEHTHSMSRPAGTTREQDRHVGAAGVRR